MNKSDLTEQLFNTIIQLRRLVSQRAYKSYEERTATMLQFSALNFLKDQSAVSIGDLAAFLQLSKSSATQLTERLVKMGLVKRISDRKDRRIIRLAITPKGENGRIILKKKTMEKISHILSKIPKRDVKELIRIHNKLIEALNKEKL